jgi:hypothetical protein
MKVKGVLWHSTGANNPNLKRYVQPSDNDPNKDKLIKIIGKNTNGNDWNHILRYAGLNCWIGKLANGSVAAVQTMPWDYRPWGCGSGRNGSCNNGWIQFEICEDSLSDKSYFNKVYNEACELTAYLCKMFNIDPNGTILMNGIRIPTILDHAESYKLGFGSNHGDVQHWLSKYGKSMQTVRKDVSGLILALPSPTLSNSIFEEGSAVKIKSGAKYYNGKPIPSWVQSKCWVVKEVNGDRVVIDKSTDGKNAICSAINAQYLELIN